LKEKGGELLSFKFLQQKNIRIVGSKPSFYVFKASANRVYIPTGNNHKMMRLTKKGTAPSSQFGKAIPSLLPMLRTAAGLVQSAAIYPEWECSGNFSSAPWLPSSCSLSLCSGG
jgi:hypothetical protein